MTKQPRRQRWPTVRSRPAFVAGFAVAVLVSIAIASQVQPQVDLTDVAIDSVGSPQLELDREHVDFGDVSFNQMVEATFELHNSGDATLLFVEEPFVELKDGC